MVRVVGLGDCLDEGGVARRTPDIFRRRRIGARYAQCNVEHWVGRQTALNLDAVIPVVAEVIDLAERAGCAERGCQAYALFASGRLAKVIVRVGDAVAFAGNLELVQVAVLPTHHDLNDLMQLGQRDRLRQPNLVVRVARLVDVSPIHDAIAVGQQVPLLEQPPESLQVRTAEDVDIRNADPRLPKLAALCESLKAFIGARVAGPYSRRCERHLICCN